MLGWCRIVVVSLLVLVAVSLAEAQTQGSGASAGPTGKTLVAVVKGTVLFIDCVTGNFFSINKDKYVAQTGKEPVPGLRATTELPPEVLAALTSPSNPAPADQRILREQTSDVCADYTLVTSLVDRARRDTSATGPTFTNPPATAPVTTPGTDLQSCASPPCF